MKAPFLKVCGIRNSLELEMVARYAEASGVVFDCGSKRDVGIDKVKEILRNARIPVYLVTLAEDLDMIGRLLEMTEAQHLQLHSENVSPRVIERIKEDHEVEIIKAFRVPSSSSDPTADAKEMLRDIERYCVDRILLDTGAGTGRLHDLRVSKIIAEEIDVIIAGGLNPGNIGRIVSYIRPYGVDVSSGVESQGIKSEELISSFSKELKNIEIDEVKV